MGNNLYGNCDMCENVWLDVNEWIWRVGVFDVVVDFDVVLWFREDKSCFWVDFDFGDYLYLNVLVFEVMVVVFFFNVFEMFCKGVKVFI